MIEVLLWAIAIVGVLALIAIGGAVCAFVIGLDWPDVD